MRWIDGVDFAVLCASEVLGRVASVSCYANGRKKTGLAGGTEAAATQGA